MGKIIKIITIMMLLGFCYLMFKRFFYHRKLRKQGIEIPQERFRPITLLSITMIVMYTAYLIYYFVEK